MIDLYGQCVQISVYDEDYQGTQVFEVADEPQAVTEAVSVTEGTSKYFEIRMEWKNLSFSQPRLSEKALNIIFYFV